MGDAAPLLWKSRLPTVGHNVQRKDRFMMFYDRYCQPVLSNVILEWFRVYNCNEAYQDFYALKLLEVANLFMFGERAQGDLKRAIQKKPDAQIHFLYDSDAWEKLGD